MSTLKVEICQRVYLTVDELKQLGNLNQIIDEQSVNLVNVLISRAQLLQYELVHLTQLIPDAVETQPPTTIFGAILVLATAQIFISPSITTPPRLKEIILSLLEFHFSNPIAFTSHLVTKICSGLLDRPWQRVYDPDTYQDFTLEEGLEYFSSRETKNKNDSTAAAAAAPSSTC